MEFTQAEMVTYVNRVDDKDLTAEQKETAKELTPIVEKNFQGAMSQNESGQYIFDYSKAKNKLGKDQDDEIQAEIDRLTAAGKKNQSTDITPYEMSE